MNSRNPLRSRRLCRSLALAFGLAAESAHASSVTSCADDGSAGTLRSLIASASNNAVIDLAACNLITLTKGELKVPVSVTLQGSTSPVTVLDANFGGRALHSTSVSSSNRSLTLKHIDLVDGLVSSMGTPAYGGCIMASTVTLDSSTVNNCEADSDSGVFGGAIYADAVYVNKSTVESSRAHSSSNSTAGGGAIFAVTTVQCVDGMIRRNSALTDSQDFGEGGGIYVALGDVGLVRCSMDSNIAQRGGAIFQTGSNGVALTNSTVSGNHASLFGAVTSVAQVVLNNSTIAFNQADSRCGGIYAQSGVIAQSSIVANNQSGDPSCIDLDVAAGSSITGANNLISAVTTAVPADTIVADPLLTPLVLRGGYSLVHALSQSSPALNHGNNPLSLSTDQRGSPRLSGSSVDIGAFERQPDDDEIFYGGFL